MSYFLTVLMYHLFWCIWLLHEWNCAPVLPELDAYVPSKWTASAECAWEIGAAEEYVAALAQLDMQSDEPLYLTAALGVPMHTNVLHSSTVPLSTLRESVRSFRDVRALLSPGQARASRAAARAA